MAVADFWRVVDGKIVERWNVVQEVPEKSVNDNTVF
jgi:predicted SnoaL-like aldol condensation-catalyzing enzyme